MTTPPHETSAPQRLMETRVLLLIVASVVPAMGLAVWSKGLVYDPFVARILLSATALSLFAATFSWPRFLPRVSIVVQAFAHMLYLWFCFVAAKNGMTEFDAVGLVPLAIVAPVFCRSRLELAVCLLIEAAAMVAIAVTTPQATFPPHLLGLISIATALGMGMVALARNRLEVRLSEANRTLETKVVDRTAALERSLATVEAEASERARAERAALRASRAKSTFLANMSHELRTPLNAILGYSEMVSDELEGERDDLVADLDKVRAAGTHLLGLIDGVLDLSRVEAQELDLRIEPVDVAAAVRDALLLLPTLNESVPVHIEVTDVLVLADSSRLRQVCANLLANALQHTPSGSVTVKTRVDGERVLIDFIDTGVGIPAHELDRIFERFTQVDPLHDGVGLGLAVCRMLIDQMGGSIRATSTIGEGSRITVALLHA